MNENFSIIDHIRTTFGMKAKVILAIRHGDKTADGKFITIECLRRIMTNGTAQLIPDINKLQMGSSEGRSTQTGMACALWVQKNGGYIDLDNTLPADPRLGSAEIFSMYDEATRARMKEEGLKNYETLVVCQPKKLEAWQQQLRDWVNETFAALDDGDICLSVSHSPTVEAIYNAFAEVQDPKMIVKELEGVFLVQFGDGTIRAFK